MEKFKIILTIVITLLISFVLIVFFDHVEASNKNIPPKELYQVYLGGERLGLIESKDALEQYINNKQEEVKKKYNIDKVYPPNNLYIQKYIGYDSNIMSEEDMYNIIKEKSPFTIKGYVATIKKDSPIKINVLDKTIWSNAVTKTIEAFIPKNQYSAYLKDKQAKIKTTGSIIENVDILQDRTIKQSYIPIDEPIFTDEKTLAKYLLFGTLEEQAKYTVKPGDTIENIAFDNKLGVEEFLLVNPEFNNSNNLLFPGEVVQVGLIKPIFDVVEVKQVVEDKEVPYKTTVQYDQTLASGKSYVKQAGVAGTERVAQRITYVSGEINSGAIISSEIIRSQIDEIIVKGSKTNKGSYTVITANSGGWVWPTNSPYIITSVFGWRWGRLHEGIDISGTGYGSPIYSANAGVVYQTGYQSSLGNYVIIAHPYGYYGMYAHMSKIYAVEGQSVKAGTKIGAMGATGDATGTHLHFGMFNGIPYMGNSKPFDPFTLFK